MTPSERERLVALERENRELTRTTEILKTPCAFSPRRHWDRRNKVDAMVAYIDAHRERFGVESTGSALPIDSSTVSPSSPAGARADPPIGRCPTRRHAAS